MCHGFQEAEWLLSAVAVESWEVAGQETKCPGAICVFLNSQPFVPTSVLHPSSLWVSDKP